MAKSSQGGDQLVREARIALPILGLLFLAFVLAGYRRFSGWTDVPPAQVPTGPPPAEVNPNAGKPNTAAPFDDPSQPDSRVLPGAEIRRPPSMDGPAASQPNQTAPRRNTLPGNQAFPRSQEYERLPSEPRSPARDPSMPARNQGMPARDPSPLRRSGNELGRSDTDGGVHKPRVREDQVPINATDSYAHAPSAQDGLPSGQGAPTRPGPPRNRQPELAMPAVQPPSSPDTQIRMAGHTAPELSTTRIPSSSNQTMNEIGGSTSNVATRSERVEEPVQIRLVLTAEDSYWTIAEQAYGSGQYFRAVHAFMQDQGLAGRLGPGDELILPPFNELAVRYRQLLPADDRGSGENQQESSPATVIADGESTLFELAAFHLGQAARYNELLSLNRHRLPSGFGGSDLIPAGTEIQMPFDKRADSVDD